MNQFSRFNFSIIRSTNLQLKRVEIEGNDEWLKMAYELRIDANLRMRMGNKLHNKPEEHF